MIYLVKLKINVIGVGDVKSISDREVVRDVTAPTIAEALRLATENVVQIRVISISELTQELLPSVRPAPPGPASSPAA